MWRFGFGFRFGEVLVIRLDPTFHARDVFEAKHTENQLIPKQSLSRMPSYAKKRHALLARTFPATENLRRNDVPEPYGESTKQVK